MSIFVDLDGTLLKISTTSYLIKSLKINQKLFFFLMILLNQRAKAKAYLTTKAKIKNLMKLISNEILSFVSDNKTSKFDIININVLKKLISIKDKNKNTPIILATGSNKIIARKVVNCINTNIVTKNQQNKIFDEYIGSDSKYNAVGKKKAELIKIFMKNNVLKINDTDQIQYFGNTWQDIPVWIESKRSFVVSKNIFLIFIIKFLKKIKIIDKFEIV